MHRVMFLTNMFPRETQEYYCGRGFVRGGENITFIQQSLIEGLDSILDIPCSIINKLLVKNNSGKKRLVPKVEWSHADGAHDVSFSYLNYPGFSSNLLYYFAKPIMRKTADSIKANKCFIIAYGLTNYTLKALSYFKKRLNAVTALIVPDLPQYTKDQMVSGLHKIKNNVTNYITNQYERRFLKDVDLLLPFSEKMVSSLSFQGKYHVLEGVCTDSFAKIVPEKLFDAEKTVLYGGGLHRKYGLDVLLDSFKYIDNQNVKLILCGDGSYVKEIKERAIIDSRITFLGRVPRERLLALQAGADVLVNPRSSSQVFSDFSFPSKNMEYLSSGVPFIGFHLGGIPEEYDSYINYPSDESASSLAKKIKEVCFDYPDDARKTALKAREFVLNKKNKYVQAKAILDAASEFFANNEADNHC